MTSIPYAFAWTMWRQHRDGLRLLGKWLIAVGVLSVLLTQMRPEWVVRWAPGILPVLVVVFSIPCTLAIVILTYASEGEDLLARESCFPPPLLRLPVQTAWLAAWPIAVGAVTISTLWVVVAFFLLRPWFALVALQEDMVQVPLWWPALLAAAILAWSQALMWHSYGLPWMRIAGFMLLFTAAVCLTPQLVWCLAEPGLCGVFAGCVVLGWAAAYVGVRRARQGETPDWQFLLAPAQALYRRLSGPRTAFASAGRAQYWMERRLTGYSLPFMMVLVTTSSMWPLVYLPLMDPPMQRLFSLERIVPVLMLMPVFFAGVFGAVGGGGYSPGIKSRKTGLGSFVAGLPMTTSDMVAAMLRSATFSTLLTWAWVFLTLAWVAPLVLARGQSELPGLWRSVLARVPPEKIALGLAAAAILVILAIVWTWKRQIDRLYFTLSGRVWVGTVSALSAVAMWVFLGAALAILASFHRPSREWLYAGVPWVLGVVMIPRVILAVWAIREVVRRGFVKRRTAALAVAGWLVVAGVSIGVLVFAIPPELVWTPYVVFAVLFALPMVRLPAAYLVLDWNRHR